MAKLYFADDGNYGDATDLVVVDLDTLDEHLTDSVETYTTDNSRLAFVKWFMDNDHKALETDYEPCDLCAEHS